MSLSLICACGARVELDEALAGQEVACPECQQPLKVPSGTGQTPAVRTSALALVSLILSVIGAFTVVGTAAAVVLGLVAVVQILRNRERLAGMGYAVAGIILGLILTPLTVFAFSSVEPFGVASWVRERNMAETVDTTGPLEVIHNNWAITRPSEKWGVARFGQLNDPTADLFLNKSTPDVVLVQIKQNAYVDVREQGNDGKQTFDQFRGQYLDEYQTGDFNLLIDDAKSKEEGMMRINHGVIKNNHALPALLPDCSGQEVEMEVKAAGQPWTMLVRFYHNKKTNRFYVLRAYTTRRGYAQVQADFKKAFDSFRFVK